MSRDTDDVGWFLISEITLRLFYHQHSFRPIRLGLHMTTKGMCGIWQENISSRLASMDQAFFDWDIALKARIKFIF